MVQKLHQRCPVAGRVEQAERLVVQAQLAPCQHLEELVERARAARQHDDRVGIHEHDLLALVHGLGHDVPRRAGPGGLAPHKVARDNAQRVTPCRPRRAGHRAHQPDLARAVDQPPPGLGQSCAQPGGIDLESGLSAGA
jgi:hypothetical protein